MGQYHYIANIDRKEFIHPHRFGDGLKLMEFGLSGTGTMAGLAILLAASNKSAPRGGGDLHPRASADAQYAQLLMDHIVGRWAGDRIAIIGDYWENDDVEDLSTNEIESLWGDENGWTDISAVVIDALELDHYVKSEREKMQWKGNMDGADNFKLMPDGSII